MLQQMEDDMGLGDLSEVEKNVLLAVSDLSMNCHTSSAGTKDLLKHKLVERHGRATTFRALSKLELQGKINKCEKRRGRYFLTYS